MSLKEKKPLKRQKNDKTDDFYNDEKGIQGVISAIKVITEDIQVYPHVNFDND